MMNKLNRRRSDVFVSQGGDARQHLTRAVAKQTQYSVSRQIIHYARTCRGQWMGCARGNKHLRAYKDCGARSNMQQYVSVQECTQQQEREACTKKPSEQFGSGACAGTHKNVGNARYSTSKTWMYARDNKRACNAGQLV